jgi:hypothetical protein
MSHLEERVSVACPSAQAGLRIRNFFANHADAGAEAATLTLRLDINLPPLMTPFTLQRSVLATIAPNHLTGDMTPRYRVQWAPEVPGPFPLFSGELLVGGESDYDTFSLRLSGDYTPPLGFFGKAFDLALGNRVAQATASDLLCQVRDLIERDYQEDEARKPHHVAS